MPVYGCHLINSGCLRTLDTKTDKSNVYLCYGNTFDGYNLNLDCLVVVDNGRLLLSEIEKIIFNLRKFAKKVICINSLAARLCNAVKFFGKSIFNYLIVVTITKDDQEIHILEKNNNNGYILKEEIKSIENIESQILSLSSKKGTKFFVLHENDLHFKHKLKFIDINYEKFDIWDTMIMNGGLAKAGFLNNNNPNIVDFVTPIYYRINNNVSVLLDSYERGSSLSTRQTVYLNPGQSSGVLEICEKPQLKYDLDKGYLNDHRVLYRKKIDVASNYSITWKVNDQFLRVFVVEKVKDNQINNEKKTFSEALINGNKNAKIDKGLQSNDKTLINTKNGIGIKPTVQLYPVKPKEKALKGYAGIVDSQKNLYKMKTQFVYQLFSTNYCYYDKNGKMIFNKIKTTPVADTDWVDRKAAERCFSLFDEIPDDYDVASIVIIHDGSYERKYVEQVYNKCLKRTPNVMIISEVMSFLMLAASKLELNIAKEDETLGVVFLFGGTGYIYYFRRIHDKLVLFSEAKYSIDKLQKNNYEKLKNIIMGRISKRPIIIISDKPMDSNLKNNMNRNWKYVEIENFGKAAYEGALTKGKFISGITPKCFDIAEYCEPIFYQLKGKASVKLFDVYKSLPFNITKPINESSDSIIIYQHKCLASEKRYEIFSSNMNGKNYDLVISAKKNGTMEVNLQKKESISYSGKYNLPTVLIEPCKDAYRAIRQNNACVIRFMLERNELSIESIKYNKYDYIKTPINTNSISDSISLSRKPITVGQAALEDIENNSKYVIKNFVNILQNYKQHNEVVYKNGEYLVERNTIFGRRLIPIHVVLSIFLTALVKMAEKYYKCRIKCIFFAMPISFKSDQVNQIRKACTVSGLTCSGMTQFSNSFYV